MQTKTLAMAAVFMLTLGGAALAQTPAGGSAERNLNNPGSVKSNSEKMDERATGPATSGVTNSTGSTMAPGVGGTSAAPTAGHSSGGGTSSGGMAR